MMTVSRRDGHAANSMQKVVCVMDANTPITVAAQGSGPDGQTETSSSPLTAGSSPQRRGSRDKSESAAMGEREAAELGRLEGRLMAEYGASLGTDAVIRCIADAVGHFDEAPVRTYVMLLVERRATAQLRDQARRAAADPGDGQGRPF
jgi:hypothetical protein